jgi:hypothetical protein
VIKAKYCSQKKMGKDGMWVDLLLDPYELDLPCLFFKMTMAANNESVLKEVLDKNNESVLKEVLDKNLVFQLWAKITYFPIFKIKLLEFFKLAKITCVHVLGFVKDEWCFSTMAFIKDKLRNRLSCHLDLCTWFYVQQLYKLEDFHLKWPLPFGAT